MSVYLDASFLVSLYSLDGFSARASAYVLKNTPVAMVSDFAALEFSSAISKRVRLRQMTGEEGRRALSAFDASIARSAVRVTVEAGDVAAADAYVRRFDLKLRAADALNIAIAQRLPADLVTFDETMAAAAKKIGLAVIVP